jgi:hypothetical protein
MQPISSLLFDGVANSPWAARAREPPSGPLGLGLCGIALLGDTDLGVADAEDGLSDDLNCLAGDFLLIRIFAGAQFAGPGLDRPS